MSQIVRGGMLKAAKKAMVQQGEGEKATLQERAVTFSARKVCSEVAGSHANRWNRGFFYYENNAAVADLPVGL